MKTLFERLSALENWTIKDSVRLSLDQVAASSYVQEPDAPAGIYNFGLLNPVELGSSERELIGYARALRRRIEAFEPRIRIDDLAIRNERVMVRATVTSTNEAISWTP